MNRKEFLKELEDHLFGLSKDDVKEILEDYEEHFKIGKKKKRREVEIAKSLGNPKEIAREARKELKKGKSISFEEEAMEFWIKLKILLKQMGENIKREVPHAIKNFRKLFGNKKGKIRIKKKDKVKGQRKGWKITLLILLNFFVVLWLWIGLFAGIISLIVSIWSVVASGIASILAIIFSLAMPLPTPINNLLLSGLFGSIGLTCFGFIFSIATWQLGKGFFWLTGKYLRWNNKIFGGKK